MFLPRTDLAIQECEQHLVETGALGSPVESYLTQHILVILCAEMQQEIYKLVKHRCSKNTDEYLAKFVETAQEKVLRSVQKAEIAGFLGHFGLSVKEQFNKSISESEISIYNNAVLSRHDVAHRMGSNTTFEELKSATEIAKRILGSIEVILDC
jgi:hypothetical protein